MNKNKILKLLIIIGLLILFSIKISPFLALYQQAFNYEELDSIYKHSQFAPNPEDVNTVIQDDQLYAYAGYFYLTTGKLDSINIEHPPLGKYLFGASVLVFNNPVVVQLPLALAFLILSFVIAFKTLRSFYLATLIPLLLLFEDLFLTQLQQSLLDLFQVTMILLFLYLNMILKFNKHWHYALLGTVLGVVASIKFPVIILFLFFAFVLKQIFVKKISWKIIIIPLVAGGVYLLTYSPLLINQELTSFINLQVRALRIHATHVPNYPWLAPTKVMLANQWPVWFDQVKPIWSVASWWLVWPVLAVSFILSPIFYFTKSSFKIDWGVFLFAWSYFLFINSRLFFPHYLLTILPLMYLVLIWEIKIIVFKFYSSPKPVIK